MRKLSPVTSSPHCAISTRVSLCSRTSGKPHGPRSLSAMSVLSRCSAGRLIWQRRSSAQVWLEELAAVASAKGEAERAATLWAATDAQYERLGMAVIEEGRQVRERYRHVVD